MLWTYILYYGVTVIACFFAALADRCVPGNGIGLWPGCEGGRKTLTLYHFRLFDREFLCRVDRAGFFLFCGTIPLILVSGLRWETGVDHMNYFWMFTNIHYNLANHAEVGFYLLSQLVWYFTEDLSVLFLLCAVITVAFLMAAVRQNSRCMLLSVFLYMGLGFFFYSMNSMRHFMALSIFLYACKYLKSRRFWPYAGWILLAASFQKMALLAIPLYLALTIRWKYWFYAVVAAGLLLALVLRRPLLDLAYRFGFGFYQAIEAETSGWSIVNIGITLGLSVMAFLYRKQLLERSERNIVLINAAWFGLLFFSLCGWIPEYTRIGQYMTVLSLFLVPEILLCEERKKIRRIYFAAILAGFSAYMALIIWNAQNPLIGWAPYQSVFQRTEYYKDLIPFWPLA